TFTAHVANISRMIELCDAPALVLLDEVGTGTDPEEGSALGVAVVDHFRRACGAHVLATTHYSGLKIYAANEDAVINASVEFDEKTLQPTYKLLVGLAGSSSGLEIARRFGFPDRIVSAAAMRVSASTLDATNYLQRIKREAEDAEALRRALEEERAAVAEKYASLDAEARKRERERQASFERELLHTVEEFEKRSRELSAKIEDRATRTRIERDAHAHAAELRREAKRAARPPTSNATFNNSTTNDAAHVSGNNGGVRVVRDGRVVDFNQTSGDEQERQAAPPARDIIAGDRVRLRTFGSIGIVDKLKGNEAEVRVGSVRLREKIANLELLAAAPVKAETKRTARVPAAAANNTEVRLRANEANERAEINLIGRTTDEAVDLTDKFLDQAYLSSLSIIRIIHGHGTGALRRAITEHLRNHPHVERFTPAPPDQGGAGATIVEVKQ
ncbi:MAG: Smr/MutS family protein, partial [Pyrinomonadaceae bacterium]